MESVNYFDIVVFVIFSFVSYSLYKTLRGDSSDIIISSSKSQNNNGNIKLPKPMDISFPHHSSIRKKHNSVPSNGNLSDLDVKVLRLMKMDKNFEPQSFLVNSKLLFGNIFSAFYKKDLSSINNIITPEVFEKLKSSIDTFDLKHEKFNAEIVRFKSISIYDIIFSSISSKQPDSTVSVVLDFQTEQSVAVLDDNNNVIRGDANQIISMNDRFVFTRDFSKQNSAWLLSDVLPVS